MSRPYATENDYDSPVSPGSRGVPQARGAASSMKNILYGGDGSEGGGGGGQPIHGKKHVSHAGGASSGAPFATSNQYEAGPGPANGGHGKLGDTGDKFAVGAAKVGAAAPDLNIYSQNHAQVQATAQAARLRNISGGGGVF